MGSRVINGGRLSQSPEGLWSVRAWIFRWETQEKYPCAHRSRQFLGSRVGRRELGAWVSEVSGGRV